MITATSTRDWAAGRLRRDGRALHAADIKVIIDIVPNHTSNRHSWFRQALAAGRGARNERYIFRDGRGGEQPPNDWESLRWVGMGFGR